MCVHVILGIMVVLWFQMWLTTSSAESKDMDVTQMSLMEDPTEDREEGDSEDDRNLKRCLLQCSCV